ncbi:alcohol dehydrogenase catalytic domain-containing protein, partial [Oleiphilus sp. HI0079]|uniref:alcohol dehydrogenase catalytic domain-containing protein n=2 Tax=Oleiphilus TaxID=141450 RepID=UPI0018D34548
MSFKKIIISEFGGPEVLKLVMQASLPEPSPQQVRIKVLTAGAAFTDTMIRKGQYPDVKDQPPFTPGYDLVGRVDKIGPEASGFALGDLVADLTVIGAYAEYICLDADKLTLVPEGCQPNEAVSLILSYITAYQMLHRIAKVQKRQSILIHGAGGAVGTAMLQLAKQLGAKVYGSGSKSKHSLIESLG